jgi:MSHA biogenesis protein MshN
MRLIGGMLSALEKRATAGVMVGSAPSLGGLRPATDASDKRFISKIILFGLAFALVAGFALVQFWPLIVKQYTSVKTSPETAESRVKEMPATTVAETGDSARETRTIAMAEFIDDRLSPIAFLQEDSAESAVLPAGGVEQDSVTLDERVRMIMSAAISDALHKWKLGPVVAKKEPSPVTTAGGTSEKVADKATSTASRNTVAKIPPAMPEKTVIAERMEKTEPVQGAKTQPRQKPASPPPAQQVAKIKPAPKPVVKPEAMAPVVTKPVARPPAPARRQAPSSTKQQPLDSASPKLQKSSQPLQQRDVAERHYRDGLTLLQNGRLAEAESTLRQALAERPAHAEARRALASLLTSNNRYFEAQILLREGVRLNPADSDQAQMLARIYLDQDMAEEAMQLLERGQAHSKNDAAYLALLGVAYQRVQRFAEASSAYQQALMHKPQEGRWWVGLGIALESGEEWRLAERAYSRALTTDNLPANLVPFTRQRLDSLNHYIN